MIKSFCTILIFRHLLIPGNAEKLLSGLQEVWDVEVSVRIQYYPRVTLLGGLSNRLLGFLEQLLRVTEKGWGQYWDDEALKVCLH